MDIIGPSSICCSHFQSKETRFTLREYCHAYINMRLFFEFNVFAVLYLIRPKEEKATKLWLNIFRNIAWHKSYTRYSCDLIGDININCIYLNHKSDCRDLSWFVYRYTLTRFVIRNIKTLKKGFWWSMTFSQSSTITDSCLRFYVRFIYNCCNMAQITGIKQMVKFAFW